ncbi:MAG: radical SAM protein [Chlamydiae bacterium]|nr:radical SAM protein [Chlamydiota bacterium]MBI3265433.1 radical SAM protein [Chlamydiota bacterium]
MGYLFGPVYSSRLGWSLGVDVIPHKICNFDCIYCECGKGTLWVNRRGHFVQLGRLIEEFENYLEEQGKNYFNVVTITGSGEPTLEIQLGRVIDEIKKRLSKPVAVLTNGSWMRNEDVQKDLALADIVLPSLDAVSPEVFKKVDQPCSGIEVESIISGMIDFRQKYAEIQFWLEILMVSGVNDSPEEIHLLKKVIDRIKPHQVHVGTVTRPPAYPEAKPLSQERLREIQAFIVPSGQQFLWPVSLFSDAQERSFPRCKQDRTGHDVNFQMVLETVKRRPCSLNQLVSLTHGSEDDLLQELNRWCEEGKLIRKKYEGQEFFAWPFKP